MVNCILTKKQLQ